jgi:MFS family permease
MSAPTGTTAPTRTDRLPGTVAGLIAAVLIAFIAFGAVIPVLPDLVLHDLHGSRLLVGAAFAASGLAALLARPYAGRLAQRYGSRTVMVYGCLAAAAIGAGYALPAGLTGLIAVRVLTGVVEAMIFTAGSVWVVALAPAHRRAETVGYYGLAMWGGWTLGPLIGQLLRTGPGYPAVWLLAAAAPAGAAAILLLLPRDRITPGGATARLVPRSVLLPGAALALAAFGYAALTGFAALHLAARGIGNGAVLLSVFAGAYVTVRLVAGRLPDRLGPRPIVIWCGVAEAAGLLLITVAPAWWVAAAGALIMGGGFTLLYPALALVVLQRTSEHERGPALGAFTSFWDLGIGGAGLITGALALLGYSWVFATAAVLAVLAAITGTAALARPRAPGPVAG